MTKGRFGQLGVICVAISLVFVGNGMIAPMVPLYSVSLGASPALVGLFVAAAFLFPLFLAVPAGALVDQHGTKKLMLLGTILLAGSPFLVTLLPGYASLALLQVIGGLGHLITIVAAQSFVAELGAGGDRERNFGWYTTFISIGQLLGPLLAGVLVEYRGFGSGFAVAGVVAGLALLLMTQLRDRSQSIQGRTSGSRSGFPTPGQIVELASSPGIQVGLLVSSTIMIALIAHQSFLPAYLDLLRYPATVIGVVVSFRAFVTIIVRPWMPQIIALLRGRYMTLLIMTATAALGLCFLGYAINIWMILFVSGLIGIGQGIAQPLTMVTVVDNVDDTQRGIALGLRLSANRLMQVSSPVVLGLVGQAAGYGPLFLVGGLLTSVTVAILLVRRSTYGTL